MITILENDKIQILGFFFRLTEGIATYKYIINERTGIQAMMNSGEHCGEIRTLIVMPQSARIVAETDADDNDFPVEFDADSLEWEIGSDESIAEVYYKYADL